MRACLQLLDLPDVARGPRAQTVNAKIQQNVMLFKEIIL